MFIYVNKTRFIQKLKRMKIVINFLTYLLGYYKHFIHGY